jgi:diguanylate cyclase (GGDEF)-like protein
VRRIGPYNFVALLGLLSALTLLVCVVVMTGHMDSREAARERLLLTARVDADIQSMKTSMDMWAKNDEAVRRLDHARDSQWAAATIRNFSDTSAWIYTFDRDDRFISGQHAPGAQTASLRQLEAALPGRVAALRSPSAATPGNNTRIDFFWSGGALYALAVTPFSPGSAAVRLRHAVPPLLVAVMPYKVLLRTNLAGMGLEGIDVSRTRGGAAAKPINNLRGETIAWIEWQAAHPGADLLRTILWPMLALSIAFIAVLVFAHLRGLAGQRKLIASEARANYIAFHDQLTDLANRRCLIDALGRAVEKASRGGCDLALLLIDLDRFKLVNDTYGHECGDELIKETARRLKALCRDSHDLCARLGGDEFVILAQNCGIAGAEQMARRVLESLSRPVMLSMATIQAGGSVGVAIFHASSNSESLLRDADRALYCAKGRGRNTFCLSPPATAVPAAVGAWMPAECIGSSVASEAPQPA